MARKATEEQVVTSLLNVISLMLMLGQPFVSYSCLKRLNSETHEFYCSELTQALMP